MIVSPMMNGLMIWSVAAQAARGRGPTSKTVRARICTGQSLRVEEASLS